MAQDNENDMVAFMARMDERTEGIVEDVRVLRHVLIEGNGVPPVTAQLATLTEKVSTLEEVNREKRIPRQVWFAILVSAVLGIAGIIMGVRAG